MADTAEGKEIPPALKEAFIKIAKEAYREGMLDAIAGSENARAILVENLPPNDRFLPGITLAKEALGVFALEVKMRT